MGRARRQFEISQVTFSDCTLHHKMCENKHTYLVPVYIYIYINIYIYIWTQKGWENVDPFQVTLSIQRDQDQWSYYNKHKKIYQKKNE